MYRKREKFDQVRHNLRFWAILLPYHVVFQTNGKKMPHIFSYIIHNLIYKTFYS